MAQSGRGRRSFDDALRGDATPGSFNTNQGVVHQHALGEGVIKALTRSPQRGGISDDRERFQPQEWTLFQPSTCDRNRAHHCCREP